MDKCSSDAEFDSYWDYEAKNKNRNRIRVGRQYQAAIPPLLKPGDKDGRRFEDLETLKWKPEQLNSSELDRYFSMARAISSFSRAIRTCREPEETDENTFQAAVKELADFVTSHHPCHHDAACEVPHSQSSTAHHPHGECSSSGGSNPACNSPGSNEWSASEAHLFSQAVEACGKNFCAIKKDYLPWKPVRSLIEYYYSYGKPEKPDTPPPLPLPQPSKVPSPYHVKVEKEEDDDDDDGAVPSCSHDPADETHENVYCKVECRETKEEPIAEERVKQEDIKEEEGEGIEITDSQVPTTSTPTTAAEVSDPIDDSGSVSLANLEDMQDDSKPDNHVGLLRGAAGPSQTTVGSLKFFLGGRLVLKLNAQQGNNISGTRCQWVQSNDTPKHLSKKLKPKKPKVLAETNRQGVADSPTHKKKVEEDSIPTPRDGSPAAKKARTQPFGSELDFPPLCSSSWTPPVADGQESVELDDASSKTSEGCISPIVFGPRGIKSEVRTETPVDHKQHLDIQDGRHARLKMEPVACNSHSDSMCSENYLMHNSGGRMLENVSPKSLPEDSTCSHEVLNHKSALSHSKSFYTKTSRSGSPSAKLFNKRPSPCSDLSEKARSALGFQSPTTNVATEIPIRENVLDLSSRTDQCKSRETVASYQTHTRISPTRYVENCSSSEGSPHTPSSIDNNNSGSGVCCKSSSSSSCKSSNCLSCRKAKSVLQQVPNVDAKDSSRVKSCRKKLNVCQYSDVNGAPSVHASADKCCSALDVVVKDNCDRCTCCVDQSSSSSCASPKCSKSYLSPDQVCNKEGQASRSPSHQNNSVCVASSTEDCPQKVIPWYGAAPASSLFQFYPHTYPYYIAYGVNPAAVQDSSTEAPLDLSSSKREKSSRVDVPDVQVDVPKTASDAVDRGMLYQLLKNKAAK